MRARTIVASAVLAIVAGSAAGGVAVAVSRSSAYAQKAADLRTTWDRYAQEGVPAASLAPLRDELTTRGMPSVWYSTQWLSGDGNAEIADLMTRSDAVWTSAMATARQTAQKSLDEWAALKQQQQSWITVAAQTTAAAWPQQLAAATTPQQLDTLATQWHAYTADQRAAVAAAQQAKLTAELASAGGPQAVLATANTLVRTASADNLDDQSVGALAAQLNGELQSGTDPTDTAQKLLTAVDALQSLVNLNNQVAGQIKPLLLDVDQALAESTPNAAALSSQYQALATSFQAARTSADISAVATQLSTLQSNTTGEIEGNQCGHSVPAGKVITVSLTLQEMIFYQDGCAVRATPTTSGRPQLPTPTGTFHIFYKTTPFEMISPWPKSSPFYYNPTLVQWVMEFAGGGYFIHDAYWEPSGDYGPGSENIPAAASHGCIHIPTPTMEWAYSWTPSGTPVIISA